MEDHWFLRNYLIFHSRLGMLRHLALWIEQLPDSWHLCMRRPLWTAPIAEIPSLKDGTTAWFSVSQVWDSYCYLFGHSLLYTQRQCHWLCPRMTVWAQLRLNSDKMNRSVADGEIKAYAGHSSLSVWASCLPLHQTNGESGSLLTFISNAYQSHQAFPDDLLPPPHCYNCYILPPPSRFL